MYIVRIFKDLEFYSEGRIIKIFTTLLFNPNFHAIFIYRLSYVLGKTILLSPLSKILVYLNRIIFGIDIDYRANLAGGLKIVHGQGVTIGYDVRSYGKLTLYQGVTIGGNKGKTNVYNKHIISQPQLENGVIIYTNSVVVGPIILEHNSIVGSLTFCDKSLKANEIFYGNR
jgi:serine O-acetyltransferase